jgi:hypothetical protein
MNRFFYNFIFSYINFYNFLIDLYLIFIIYNIIIYSFTYFIKSYAINAFKSLLRYENSYGYIKENKEVMEALYTILINYDAMNTATHTLEVLILITNVLNDLGVNIILRSAEIFAMKYSSQIFKELVNFINDPNVDIKLNAITLICLMLEKCTDKIKVKKTKKFFLKIFYRKVN